MAHVITGSLRRTRAPKIRNDPELFLALQQSCHGQTLSIAVSNKCHQNLTSCFWETLTDGQAKAYDPRWLRFFGQAKNGTVLGNSWFRDSAKSLPLWILCVWDFAVVCIKSQYRDCALLVENEIGYLFPFSHLFLPWERQFAKFAKRKICDTLPIYPAARYIRYCDEDL